MTVFTIATSLKPLSPNPLEAELHLVLQWNNADQLPTFGPKRVQLVFRDGQFVSDMLADDKVAPIPPPRRRKPSAAERAAVGAVGCAGADASETRQMDLHQLIVRPVSRTLPRPIDDSACSTIMSSVPCRSWTGLFDTSLPCHVVY